MKLVPTVSLDDELVPYTVMGILQFDDLGPFGNPTSDSARTMVTTRTTRALIVVFMPREVGVGAIDDVLARTAEHTRVTTGGTERIRQVVSGAGSTAKELWPDVL